MSYVQGRSFVFGDWLVEPDQGRLSKNGESVSIEPKAMAVLAHLSDNAGRVVATQELLDTIWPHSVTSDEAIYQRIALLRRTLGDDSHQPRYIETVPKRGYRLVAAVHYTNDHTAGGLDRPPTAEKPGSSGFVGREREMADFKAALDGAIDGHGRLVMHRRLP